MSKPNIYTIGRFTNWRDFFIEALKEKYDFNDPREHRQSAIAKLVEDDMNAAQKCEISLAYSAENSRLGTTSYAEVGASRGAGNCLILVDEAGNEKFIEQLASHYFRTKELAMEFLLKEVPKSKFSKISKDDKTKRRSPWETAFFTGDLKEMSGLIKKLENKKIIKTEFKLESLNSFSKEIDLVVINFNKEKKHNPIGLFYLGLAYSTDIPTLVLEGNSLIYPTLPGISRRTLVGKDRFIQAEEYLTNLESQNIEEEALVYYKLMEKFNKD